MGAFFFASDLDCLSAAVACLCLVLRSSGGDPLQHKQLANTPLLSDIIVSTQCVYIEAGVVKCSIGGSSEACGNNADLWMVLWC